jgi:phage shock protein PspC (stress-responsive transcriptional regulator)
MESRKLYRSRSNRVFGGVAGGLADYFNIDPLVVRILFVVLTLVGGGGLILYIAMWIFVPEETFFSYENKGANQNQGFTMNTENIQDEGQSRPAENQWEKAPRPNNQGNLIGGLILITIGGIFLLERFIPRIDFGDLWPIILIIVGIAVLIGGFNKSKAN